MDLSLRGLVSVAEHQMEVGCGIRDMGRGRWNRKLWDLEASEIATASSRGVSPKPVHVVAQGAPVARGLVAVAGTT